MHSTSGSLSAYYHLFIYINITSIHHHSPNLNKKSGLQEFFEKQQSYYSLDLLSHKKALFNDDRTWNAPTLFYRPNMDTQHSKCLIILGAFLPFDSLSSLHSPTTIKAWFISEQKSTCNGLWFSVANSQFRSFSQNVMKLTGKMFFFFYDWTMSHKVKIALKQWWGHIQYMY